MRTAVTSMETYYERGMGFLFKLIDECPEELWGERKGGFFVWQQLYHAFYCVDYFLLPSFHRLFLTKLPQGGFSDPYYPNITPDVEKTPSRIRSYPQEG